MPALLRIENVYKHFGETQALAGLSCTLRQGEWLGLLGPNGAGKTTLIRSICGRVKFDRGQIIIGNQILDRSAAARLVQKQVGIVPQDIALYPILTAEENLRVFGSLNNLKGHDLDRQVEWALDWTGLTEHRKELVQTFSGGMKRRLNIACGIMHRPKIVLLDEPTVGVDPQSRQRIWEMLAKLQTQGVSLLLTTHQLDEAQQVCDRIVVIDQGRTIAEGTLDELLSKTIGRQRLVTIRTQKPCPDIIDRFGLVSINDTTIQGKLDNVAVELAAILNSLAAMGVSIEDLTIETPTLQKVFLALTGHDLRE